MFRLDLRRRTTLSYSQNQVSSILHICRAPHRWQSTAGQRPPVTPEELTSRLYKNTGSRKRQSVNADKTRINVLSEGLCDDVLKRLAPSLEKHKNCDIIDLNPGVGVWSSKLHEALQPRTHILMEPDSEYYLPYLQPLLDQKDSTYKFLPLSGVIWDNLRMLESDEFLPNQKLLTDDDPALEQPNNTLLLTANFGYFPNKPFLGFQSLTTLMLHQFLSAARSHALFHRYGQVRMLIWMRNREKSSILPRAVGTRKKSAVAAEVTCESVVEVAGFGHESRNKRGDMLELSSARAVRDRMKKARITTPRNRSTDLEKDAKNKEKTLEKTIFEAKRPYIEELKELEARYARDEFHGFVDKTGKPLFSTDEQISGFTVGRKKGIKGVASPEYKRMMTLRSRIGQIRLLGDKYDRMLKDYDDITADWKALDELDTPESSRQREKLQTRLSDWRSHVENIPDAYYHTLWNSIADRTCLNQDPPILLWDRRPYEPLLVKESEFFPHEPMSLLDIQPKSIWPIVRGAANLSNYDYFEFILSKLWMIPTQSVQKGLNELAPGAGEWIIPRCPSLRDLDRGGAVDMDLLAIRTLNENMLREILEAFMEWPFRPSKAELMVRIGSQGVEEGYED